MLHAMKYALLIFLVNTVKKSKGTIDGESSLTSTWLEGDWSSENDLPDVSFTEQQSGCVCRHKINDHIVCYGGRRCQRFPKNITLFNGVFDFRIKTSAIEQVFIDDLKQFSFLKSLQIDANYHLNRIAPEAFKDLINLKSLSISYNSDLRCLHPQTFKGLFNLETLRLIRNGFSNIIDATKALNANYLPSLTFLSLNENSFPHIGENSFSLMNDSKLEELELISCQIKQIHNQSLSVFKNLKCLRVGDNLLTETTLGSVLEALINENIPLGLLNLYNLGLRRDENLSEILKIIANSTISHLILSQNHIETISNGLFPYMPNIKILDLREVSTVTIATGALSSNVLPNVEVLLLGKNKLSGITPGVLLPQLSVLDLTQNSGGAHLPSYFDVTTANWSLMGRLESLDLSYNRLTTIINSTFIGLHKLRVLGLKNATIFFVSPSAFKELKNLVVLNLESNPLEPFNKFDLPIFRGLGNLEKLYLGYCRIKSFGFLQIFEPLKKLKYLDLKENDLVSLEWQIVYPLRNLIGIDLSHNQLQAWVQPPRFINNPNLTIVILKNNRLSTTTATMMEDFIHLKRLDLSQNSFACDCWSFNQTIEWLLNRNLSAMDTCLHSNTHVCSSPEIFRQYSLTKFLDASVEACVKAPKALIAPIYIFLASIIALAVALGVLLYMYRWHVRYWIFLAKTSFLHRNEWLVKHNKIYPNDYKYDVFVSYSNEDRNFIVRLVAMLENHEPFLKLCVYERDFEIGAVISEAVMEKVSASKKILLIVSNAFAKSQWCRWELQLAEYHRLFFRNSLKDECSNDTLLIIKLGPVAEVNMTPTLKYLLKSRIYLEWNHNPKKQKEFWAKLKTCLTPRDRSLAIHDKADEC